MLRIDARDPFPAMHEIVAPATVGKARVYHLRITEEFSYKSMIKAIVTQSDEFCTPRTVTILKIGRKVMMSDADMERRSNLLAYAQARGDVLIGGLGIGMLPVALCSRPGVRSITVIEKNPDVYAAVMPSLAKYFAKVSSQVRVRVCLGDVFTWQPSDCAQIVEAPPLPATFDMIYMDIWPERSPNNLIQMEHLHGRYAPLLNLGGWFGVWYGPELYAAMNARGRERFGAALGVKGLGALVEGL